MLQEGGGVGVFAWLFVKRTFSRRWGAQRSQQHVRLWKSYFLNKSVACGIFRKRRFLEKQSDFSHGVGAHDVLEKPLFSKNHFSAKRDFSRDVGPRSASVKSQSNFLRKVTFLATLARAASAKSHFARKNASLEKPLSAKNSFSRRFSRLTWKAHRVTA